MIAAFKALPRFSRETDLSFWPLHQTELLAVGSRIELSQFRGNELIVGPKVGKAFPGRQEIQPDAEQPGQCHRATTQPRGDCADTRCPGPSLPLHHGGPDTKRGPRSQLHRLLPCGDLEVICSPLTGHTYCLLSKLFANRCLISCTPVPRTAPGQGFAMRAPKQTKGGLDGAGSPCFMSCGR